MVLWSNLVQYGSESESKYFFKNLNDDFSKLLFSINVIEADIEWDQIGEYNAMNAMSAIVSLEHFGIKVTDSVDALKKYKGVSRRQEILLNKENLVIVDDFLNL